MIPPAPPDRSAPLHRRDATPEDLPAIVRIYNATIASRQVTADLEPITVDSRRGWLAAHAQAGRPVWVLADATGAVAALSLIHI